VYKVSQFLQQVMADIRICILIDGHSGSSVGDKNRDRTSRHTTRQNNLPNLVRDIHQLAPRFRRNLNRIHKFLLNHPLRSLSITHKYRRKEGLHHPSRMRD
jgi:hypothetical protein